MNMRNALGLSPKLQPTNPGPYLIVEKQNDLVFNIQVTKSGRTRIVYHSKLMAIHILNGLTRAMCVFDARINTNAHVFRSFYCTFSILISSHGDATLLVIPFQRRYLSIFIIYSRT